jgi:threonine dehydrogenase-like Zn-dependent dehydrogenase
MYGAGDVRVETVPDARLVEPTDALVTVTRAAICGSDLWPHKSMEHDETGRRMGHEFVGIVEAVGPDVRTLSAGDVVVTPFVWSDGTCAFCQEGLHTSCLHGGRYGWDGVDGGAGMESTAGRARRYGFPKQTERSSSRRSTKTTR